MIWPGEARLWFEPVESFEELQEQFEAAFDGETSLHAVRHIPKGSGCVDFGAGRDNAGAGFRQLSP